MDNNSNSNQINLEEIAKIPEKEFRQRFAEWLERDDVARSLQAKLRKDLIDNFNRTSLGKKIVSQHIRSQRLILSPLILALNTLVAEFLYAQNCHFTLSVFCTEVPYRNTLPDFEGAKTFRFSDHEISEIFEAISVQIDGKTKTDIASAYQDGYSLLFTIFKSIFQNGKRKEPEKPKPPTTATDSKSEFYRTNFRYLNKYLVILSRKVKEMSLNLEQLEKREGKGKRLLQSRKCENLNKNLNRILETLRQLTLSKRKNKKISTIVAAIEAMTKQFEMCSSNFLNISKKSSKTDEKSYEDWLSDMKTSPNGRKFLEKVESSMSKTLEREKERMSKAFETKLANEKELIRLKYKQKFLQQIGKYNASMRDEPSESSRRINESIDNKIKEFESKHQELLNRINVAEEMVAAARPVEVLIDTGADDKNIAVPNTKEIANKSNQTEENRPKVATVRLNELVQTITEQERQIDHIVFDAKMRIQELEHESNQLDKSFQDYLQRQRKEKSQIEENATAVWENYTIGKSMLSRKCNAVGIGTGKGGGIGAGVVASSRKSTDVLLAAEDRQEEIANPCFYTNLNNPKINIECDGDGDDDDEDVSLGAFENPYRKLQEGILLKKDTMQGKTLKCNSEESQRTHLSHRENEDGDEQQQVSVISSEFNLKDTTLDGIEVSPLKASPTTSETEHELAKRVFKLRKTRPLPSENEKCNIDKKDKNDDKGRSQFTRESNAANSNKNNNPIGDCVGATASAATAAAAWQQEGNGSGNAKSKDKRTVKDSNAMDDITIAGDNDIKTDVLVSASAAASAATATGLCLPGPGPRPGNDAVHRNPVYKGCDNLEIPLFSPNDKSSTSASVSHSNSSYHLDISTGNRGRKPQRGYYLSHDGAGGDDGEGSTNSETDFWN